MQLAQKKTLSKILKLMLGVFLLILLIVLWYANRLVGRISRLNRAVEEAVDSQGRLVGRVDLKQTGGDELDDLGNSFSAMSEKLFDYNDYLEKLASRLSHELRTPIAIVRSSLDNLSLSGELNGEQKATVERALEGTRRLGETISRMREASSIKQAMQSSEFENVELVQFLRNIVGGFEMSFGQQEFRLDCPQYAIIRPLAADLFAEMLDKLLTNAMDFCRPGSPIVIRLARVSAGIEISVTNEGPPIARKNLKRIFSSLVSIREGRQAAGLNLGLGLHVVKLIADFHKAGVRVENLQNPARVRFSVTLAKSSGKQ